MDDEIDALYDLPPGEFIAARDALVKRLRADQRRDEANEVKALRRPSVAAWAVNQVARRHPDALEEVLDAGTQLAAAQRRALSGIKDAGLQAAAAERRDAIQRAWRLAAAALEREGAGVAAQRQGVVETLEAASVDEAAATQVRAGRLTKELSAPSDFGAVSGFAVVAPPSGDEDADAVGDDDAAGFRRREAEQAAAAARQRADDAQRRAGDARQGAVRATAEAQRLSEQADLAAQRAADAADAAQEQAAKAEELEAEAAQAAQEAEQLAARAEKLPG